MAWVAKRETLPLPADMLTDEREYNLLDFTSYEKLV